VARKRARWKRYQNRLDPSRLVFIDETWAKTNMTRTHGRAPRGARLQAKVPHAHWKTMTFVAALRLEGITAPVVFDQPINGEWFQAYVEQVFAKLKTLLRKADERSVEAVWTRIGALLDHFSPSECANYIRHAGYASI